MDTSTWQLPAHPNELIAAVTCPVTRFVLLTRAGRTRLHLSKPFADQRLADLAACLQTGHTQASLVDLTGLSRPRMSQLCAKALGRVTA